jgi:hypothetical protein
MQVVGGHDSGINPILNFQLSSASYSRNMRNGVLEFQTSRAIEPRRILLLGIASLGLPHKHTDSRRVSHFSQGRINEKLAMPKEGVEMRRQTAFRADLSDE